MFVVDYSELTLNKSVNNIIMDLVCTWRILSSGRDKTSGVKLVLKFGVIVILI